MDNKVNLPKKDLYTIYTLFLICHEVFTRTKTPVRKTMCIA